MTVSKKKSVKKPAVPDANQADEGNGKHYAAGNGAGNGAGGGAGNGADRVGEHPHPAANGNGASRAAEREHEREMEESMEMLPDHIRKQLETIRQRSKEAQDLSREARDNYENARKTLEQFHKNSEKRMGELEEKVRQQADEYQERTLRLRAEVENIRKRSAEEREAIRKYAVENFAEGVCEIRDCLESAMESPPDNPEALREGVALTLRKLNSVMDAHGIHAVNPAPGEPFDPAVHQAVAKSADAPQPKNTVAAVARKGYTIHDRTLRPADVIVSIRNGNPAPPSNAPAKKPGGKKTKSEKSA